MNLNICPWKKCLEDDNEQVLALLFLQPAVKGLEWEGHTWGEPCPGSCHFLNVRALQAG